MNDKIKSDIQPTEEMIAAAETVFKTMAWLEVVKPKVLAYQKEILKRHQFKVARKHSRSRRNSQTNVPQIILDPKDTFLMSDEDFEIYCRESRKAQEEVGLKTDTPEECPLLVAEDLLRKAKEVLIEVMQPVTQVDSQKLLCAGLDKYNQYVELALKMLSPYVKSVPEILSSYSGK